MLLPVMHLLPARSRAPMKVDVICWTAGISACASAHHWRAAVQLLEVKWVEMFFVFLDKQHVFFWYKV